MDIAPRAAEGAEAAIRRAAELFDTDHQAVIGTLISGEIVYWNPAAERLYGWSSDEVLGRSIVEVTPSSPSRQQAVAIMSRLQEGHSWTGRFRVRMRDGTEFEAHVRDVPVQDAKGVFVGIVGVSEPSSKGGRK
jgi:PAS domain S-box-containing protein